MNLSVKKNSVLVIAGSLSGGEVETFDAAGFGWDKLEFSMQSQINLSAAVKH